MFFCFFFKLMLFLKLLFRDYKFIPVKGNIQK
ncbi:hypothetical protein AT05_02465 [Schleiferia thermophila str. Yellowstone]|nr:hypothetical protein AT05_02465 [Schleiferia thermophila str. Yellowstone]